MSPYVETIALASRLAVMCQREPRAAGHRGLCRLMAGVDEKYPLIDERIPVALIDRGNALGEYHRDEALHVPAVAGARPRDELLLETLVERARASLARIPLGSPSARHYRKLLSSGESRLAELRRLDRA